MINQRPDLIALFHELQEKHKAEKKEFNLFGVQFPYAKGREDLYNDYLGIEMGTNLLLWKGTTDPGAQATEKKEGGAAHLCLGYHKNIWRVGKHAEGTNFEHLALVQIGPVPVKIWRDANKNYVYDVGEKIETGWFGINWHHGAGLSQDNIGPYSWGCQVTQDIKDFNFVMDLILKSESYIQNNKMDISYLLLTSEEFPISKAGGVL